MFIAWYEHVVLYLTFKIDVSVVKMMHLEFDVLKVG